jgi:hypothetical protein
LRITSTRISSGASKPNGAGLPIFYQARGMRDVTVEDIYIGNGVSELIVQAMQALLNSADNVDEDFVRRIEAERRRVADIQLEYFVAFFFKASGDAEYIVPC